MAGVASFGGYDPKGDSDKKVKALEKRNDMRKRNSGEELRTVLLYCIAKRVVRCI